ncbi:MAG: SAM-dependent methyltransferase [Gammaproteobacteria bacterium]|nr:SAM-dependent methyltransferase [Gammaproteobacteria bacterium]
MASDILPEPPPELKRHSAHLASRIRAVIRDQGPMPFSRYMEMALYEPGLGYYSAGLHKLGKEGDFTTAPELGGLFAACMARQCAEIGEELGTFEILEVGAGTGRLAAAILGGMNPEGGPARYRILERSADLRAVQRETIAERVADGLERVEWLDQPPDRDWQGVLIANEVIDALAAERFEVHGGAVRQLCVRESGEGFDWATRPAPTVLETAVRNLESDLDKAFKHEYRSELHLQLAPWLSAITVRMTRGLALFVDYGYPRSEYYLHERSDGTLMCHYRHRAHADPFFWPGLQDITAWVDFTALAEAADACGLEVEGYTTQAMFLTGCGLEAVLQERAATADDGGLALGAEARQLLMPGMMGERFQVMGLGRGLERMPSGFSLVDLRFRL